MSRILIVLLSILFSSPPSVANEKKSKTDPINFIRSKTHVSAYVGTERTEFLASTETWFYNFPLDECTASLTPEKDFVIIRYSCPASYAAEPVLFTFTSAVGQNDLILAIVNVGSKKLSREEYTLFITKPFDYAGSYQTMLKKPFDVNVVDKDNAITRVGNLREFLESNERKNYQCHVIHQSDPDYIVGCIYGAPKSKPDLAAALYYKFKLITNSQLLWVSTYRPDRTEFMGRAALKQIGAIFDAPSIARD